MLVFCTFMICSTAYLLCDIFMDPWNTYLCKYACDGRKCYIPQRGLYFTLYGSNCIDSTERGA